MPDWDALSTTSAIKRVRVAAVPRHEAEAPCASTSEDMYVLGHFRTIAGMRRRLTYLRVYKCASGSWEN